MKKTISLILVIAVMLSLSACGGAKGTTGIGDNTGEPAIKHTGKKIDGEILSASLFSEGLAFVELSQEEGKSYCIDKKGHIVFELDIDLSIDGDINSTFINGLAYVNEGLCNTTGKVTKPADVGATTFYYASTLSAGYILAEVVTADYSNTSKKLGVLNTNFEWTVEPSADLYNEFADEYGYSEIDNALNTTDYTVGDLYFNVSLEKALNLKTGEVIKDKSKIGTPSSSLWILGSGGSQYTGYYLPSESSYLSEENLILDLTKNGEVCSATSFVNGRAAIVYRNTSANKYYVTMIDEEGKHLFEPVETKYSSVETDGKYILVSDTALGSGDYAEVFNNKGEKTGEIDVSADTSKSYHLHLGDGVILVRAGIINMMSGYNGKAYYLDISCKDLF